MTQDGNDNEKPAGGGDDSDATGLPLLRTWPAVYAFVLGVFVLLVVLLSVFTVHFARAPK